MSSLEGVSRGWWSIRGCLSVSDPLDCRWCVGLCRDAVPCWRRGWWHWVAASEYVQTGLGGFGGNCNHPSRNNHSHLASHVILETLAEGGIIHEHSNTGGVVSRCVPSTLLFEYVVSRRLEVALRSLEEAWRDRNSLRWIGGGSPLVQHLLRNFIISNKHHRPS